MRKRIINTVQQETAAPELEWLDIESLAEVEISSEDAAHPIEFALQPEGDGWRAAGPGKQTIRLKFDRPQKIQRIRVDFEEPVAERTQEFVLRWSPDGGHTYHDIVRQQWNFSPQVAARETEDIHVDLPAVTALELSIIPDISGGNAIATLEHYRIA